MTGFTTLTALPAPLLRDNIDTDAIIPSREMKTTGKTGLAGGLFAGWRYMKGRTPNPDFVLNNPRYAHAPMLLGGANFGCGSSREHAVWALQEYGVRAIIAESFAPIFQANCTRNGIVPVALDRQAVEAIAKADSETTVDLDAQTVAVGDDSWAFAIGREAKVMLAEGLDAIDLTLKHADDIDTFIRADRKARPWVYLEART